MYECWECCCQCQCWFVNSDNNHEEELSSNPCTWNACRSFLLCGIVVMNGWYGVAPSSIWQCWSQDRDEWWWWTLRPCLYHVGTSQHYWRRRCNNIKARVVALVQVTERQTKIVVWLSSSSSDGKCVLTDQDFELWFHNTWKHVSSHNSRTLTTTDAINTPLTQHSILLRGASATVSQDCFDTFNESFKFFEIQNS